MKLGKIKLTQEQAKAIELWLNTYGGDKAQLLNNHAGADWRTECYKPFNSLSQADMARALLIGYDIAEKYEVGDWIAFESAFNGLIICKIEQIHVASVDTDYMGTNSCKQNFYKGNIRHATLEEIKAEKERRLWEKIGRKVWEFKDGDFGWKGDSAYHTREAKYLKRWYEWGQLKGFYPTESYISFEDGESE